TFTYIDTEHRNLDGYAVHLRTYRPLFRQLPGFQFLYVSTASGLQNEAAELFSFLVEGKGLADLIRFFDLRNKWDRKQYGLLMRTTRSFSARQESDLRGQASPLSTTCGSEIGYRRTFSPRSLPLQQQRKGSCSEASRCLVRRRFSVTAQRTGVTVGRAGVRHLQRHLAGQFEEDPKVFKYQWMRNGRR